MADFQLRVTAETQRAEKDLQRLDKTANTATKERKLNIDVSELNKNFRNVEKNIKEAGNTIQTFYRISKNIPGVGERVREFENLAKNTANIARTAPESAAALRENAKAGSILSNSFEAASAGAGRLVNNLAKAGFALFAIKEAVNVVQTAFNGFFNETIGREIKLRETILKTQTTLASTNKVFRNGTEITDPYEKIVALTGEVNKRIDSIRERSIALAGVTSNDVIEVFGIVASQVSQIGGGLKDAEDLAISFSAALGTFGLPLEQARQEIGSILRGDVGPDSILAKSLGIDNPSLAKAKTEAGGVIKFVQERLAASVAGQKIAAQGFAGVLSNIQDLGELISQRFGAGLLDPLLGGLTRVFEFLFKIREEVFAISSALGQGFGSLLANNLTAITGGSALFGQLGAGAEGFAQRLAESVKTAFNSLQADANLLVAPLRNLFEEITRSIGVLSQGLAKLAEGFISIQIENFKALVQIFSNLSEAVTIFAAGLGKVFQAYGQLLQVPFVQYLSQISAQFQLLERIGVMSTIKLAFGAVALIAAWKPIVAFFQALVARITALIGGMVAAIGLTITRLGALVAAFASTLAATNPAVATLKAQLIGLSTAFTTAGSSAEKAGASIARFGGSTTAASKAVASTIFGFIKFNLVLLAVQLGVTALIDLFGRWQQAQDKAASDQKAEQALIRLNTVYKDVGESASEATKRAKQFDEALVNGKYDEAVARLNKIKEKIQEIRDLASDKNLDLGDYARKIAQLFNPENFSVTQRPGETFSQAVLRERLQEEKKAESEKSRWAKEINKRAAEENIKLEANKRINLEKEIGELRKQQDDQIFQLRQQRAAKEVDIFRAAGELRIFQIEQANKKLIEGEEGSSRSALESLNNYISVRERGELEIETAKKQLVIEVTNLERQISDYRLENEKKIAEIRKRAGENDKAISDYQRQVAGQTSTGSLRGGAEVTQRNDRDGQQTGSDIAVAGGRGGAVQNPFSSLKITAKGFQGQGSGPRGRGFGNYVKGTVVIGGKTYEVLLGHLDQVSVNVGDVLGPGGLIGTQGMTGRATGPHVTTHVNALNGGNPGAVLGAIENAWTKGTPIDAAAQAIKPPKLQSFDDIGAPAVAKYTEAVHRLRSAMERLLALTAALTNAKTKAAFDEIAKAAFQPVGLDSYQDKLYELGGVIKSLADGTYDAFNPERSQIASEQAAKVLSSERELEQIKAGINKVAQDGLLSEKQRLAIIDSVTKQHKAFVDSLRVEEQIRQRISAITQITDFIKRIEDETARIERENEVIRMRNRLITEGVDPAIIEQEVARLRRAQELSDAQKALNTLTEQQTTLQKDLNAARAAGDKTKVAELEKKIKEQEETIKRLREELKKAQEKSSQTKSETPIDQSKNPRDIINNRIGNLKREIADLTNWGNIAVKAADGIGSAFSDAFKSVVSGASTVQEALGTMFQRIGEMFLQMATEIIAKMLVMYLLKSLLGLFGKGAMIGGTDAAGNVGPNMQAAKGATFSGEVAAFAGGGLFTNKIVKTPTPFKFRDGGVNKLGIMGEAGPEAIMPLRRGSSGRLGVDAIGLREAMNSAPGAGGAPILNMSFETTSIGGTEYVSRDQLEAAMAETRRQASRDGAQRGMTMTLDRIQNSSSTRRRIGV